MASQGTNVGSVFVNLSLDQKRFNQSVGNAIKNTENKFASSVNGGKLGGAIKKLSGALAGAFAVKKVIDFGKSCIDLGSDLAEVQNVVDVAFGSMSSDADKWAANAIENFGLSETVAKRYLGVFGSMATSFGFTTKQALDMSEQITGLVGDVASFYNLSSDESYTKLKSIFTGETESLKDLGVVMTQSALDQYALANGFGKATAEMSEQEKVLLRYQFVQDKLSNAAGDFVRTQDSWANQTRVLSLRRDSLKASIGQGLINALTPVLKLINNIIAKVQIMADAFKRVTEKIFGNAGGAGDSISSVADSAGAATSNVENIGKAAESTAKKAEKLKKAFGKQDELNIMSFDDGKSDDTSSAGAGIDTSAVASLNSALEKENETISKIGDNLERIKNLFNEGVTLGLGDFDSQAFLDKLSNIKENIKDIFTSQEVTNAMSNFRDSAENVFVSLVGLTVSVGTTLADNLVSGVDIYLSESKDYIQDKIAGIFDARAKINNITADFINAFSNVFMVFRGENANRCTAEIIGIFSDGFLGVTEIASKFGADVLNLITGPFVDNQDKIKNTIDDVLKPLSNILNTLYNGVKNTFDYFSDVYDRKIGPAITGIKDGISSLVSNVLDNWNEHIKPVLDKLSEKFKVVFEDKIQPALDKISEAFGSFMECVSALWKNVLEPCFEWLNDKLSPIFGWLADTVGSALLDAFGAIGDVVGGLAEDLEGVFDFLTSIFTGEWKADIKLKFSDTKESVTKNWNNLVGGIKDKTAYMRAKMDQQVSTVKNAWKNRSEFVKSKVAYMRAKMDQKKADLTRAWNDKISGIKGKTLEIKAKLSAAVGDVKNFVNKLIDSINKNIISKISFSIQAPQWLGGKKWGWSAPKIKRLYTGAYLKANNPQLAFVGDNRTEGEFVAPESKLEDAVIKAMDKRKGGSDNGGKLELVIHVVYEDGRKIIKKINDVQRQDGRVLLEI